VFRIFPWITRKLNKKGERETWENEREEERKKEDMDNMKERNEEWRE
jgi:hypothetical protein